MVGRGGGEGPKATPACAGVAFGASGREGAAKELAAQATGVPVLAGPKEATAIGNVLVQAVSMGELESFDAGRKLVKDSYEVVEYLP